MRAKASPSRMKRATSDRSELRYLRTGRYIQWYSILLGNYRRLGGLLALNDCLDMSRLGSKILVAGTGVTVPT